MKQRGLYYLVIGRIFSVVFSLFSIKIITNFLSPAEVGNFYLFNALITWFALVLINPVGMFYNRNVLEWQDKGLLASSFHSLNRYFVLSAILVLPIIGVVHSVFEFGFDLSWWLLLSLLVAYTYFSSWFQTLTPTLNLFGSRKEFVILTMLAQFVGLVCALLMIKFIEPKASNWFWGILIGQVLASIFAWKQFKNKIYPQNPVSKVAGCEIFFNRQTLSFCFPVMLSTLFMWAQTQGYRLFIEDELGAEVLAYFGVGLGLAMSAAGVIEAITTQSMHPEYFFRIKDENVHERQKAWESMWRKAVVVYLPTMLFVASSAGVWLWLLTDPRYSSAISLLKWGALIEIFRMLTNVLYLISHSERNTKRSNLPYALGAIFVLVGVSVLLKTRPTYFLIELPWVLVSGSAATLVATYFSMRSLMNFQIGLNFISKQLLWSLPFIVLTCIAIDVGRTTTLIGTFGLGIYALLVINIQLKALRKLS